MAIACNSDCDCRCVVDGMVSVSEISVLGTDRNPLIFFRRQDEIE